MLSIVGNLWLVMQILAQVLVIIGMLSIILTFIIETIEYVNRKRIKTYTIRELKKIFDNTVKDLDKEEENK